MDIEELKKEVGSRIQYSCGCGFLTHDGKKAREHTSETNHAITVQGTICKNNKKQGR